MGLFDKIKGAVMNAADDVKIAYTNASAMGLEQLCLTMMDIKKLDPKMLGYQRALQEKCETMPDEDLDRFYSYIKKQGGIFKTHPGQETVENILVKRNIYSRDEDGTLTKNTKLNFGFFKK